MLFQVQSRSYYRIVVMFKVHFLKSAGLAGIFAALLMNTTSAATATSPTKAPPKDLRDIFSSTYQVESQNPPSQLRSIFQKLAAHQSSICNFTEASNFAISKHPVKKNGVLRYSRNAGLSMAYENPANKLVVIDDKGLMERREDGSIRSISSAEHPELAAITDTYLSLMRGRSGRLLASNDLYFASSGNTWYCGLVPKNESVEHRVGRVVLSGHGDTVTRVQNIAPNGTSRLIELGHMQKNVRFSPEVYKNYFRAGRE